MKPPKKEGGHACRHGHQKLTGLVEATQAVSSSQPKGEGLTDRLTFILCQSVQSTIRVETALCEIADKLDSLLALAQQRNDLIRRKGAP
jgi:hypothetical protein